MLVSLSFIISFTLRNASSRAASSDPHGVTTEWDAHAPPTRAHPERRESAVPSRVLLRPRPAGMLGEGDVRVMIAVVATNVDAVSCMAVASGFLSGLPVNVVGYHGLASDVPFKLVFKPALILESVRAAGLRDDDVVLFADSDTLFASADTLIEAVDTFIATSAASLHTLDARAVREGRARAPLILGREEHCHAEESMPSDECVGAYRAIGEEYKAYAQAHTIPLFVERISNLNSGVGMARVWALEEGVHAQQAYMDAHPLNAKNASWTCEQAIYAALYHDLRRHEMKSHALLVDRATTPRNPLPRSAYGLSSGVMELDEWNELSVVLDYCMCGLTQELWGNPMATYHPFRSIGDGSFEPFVQKTYTSLRVPLRRYALPPLTVTSPEKEVKEFNGLSTPPILLVRHGNNNVWTTGTGLRTVVPILHMAGGGFPFMTSLNPLSPAVDVKFSKAAHMLLAMPWYIPMHYDAQLLSEAKRYLSLLEFAAFSKNTSAILSYREACIVPGPPAGPMQHLNAHVRYAADIFFDVRKG